ncbi:unnamed protein product [Linum trigynum]|uniref:Uncharacterized protein n=1 Tax=Linum trigynum TaxID=586398 RepID=A0AAV2CYC3_9ROSI
MKQKEKMMIVITFDNEEEQSFESTMEVKEKRQEFFDVMDYYNEMVSQVEKPQDIRNFIQATQHQNQITRRRKVLLLMCQSWMHLNLSNTMGNKNPIEEMKL